MSTVSQLIESPTVPRRLYKRMRRHKAYKIGTYDCVWNNHHNEKSIKRDSSLQTEYKWTAPNDTNWIHACAPTKMKIKNELDWTSKRLRGKPWAHARSGQAYLTRNAASAGACVWHQSISILSMQRMRPGMRMIMTFDATIQPFNYYLLDGAGRVILLRFIDVSAGPAQLETH